MKICLPAVKSNMANCPNFFKSLNRYNFAAGCLISFKFEFDHVIACTLQTFNVKGSKV